MDPSRTEPDWVDRRLPHRLLEAPQPAYSDATVRRAFIVWRYCGHRNVFRDVCAYYHRLACWEDTLPVDRRATSRHHESHLFYNNPPSSIYLTNNFPKLYSASHLNINHIKRIEAIRNEQNVFNIEGFSDMKEEAGVTKHEIVLVSRMIRKYCKEHQIVLTKFLKEFKQYTDRCQIKQSMLNVKRYIRSKAIQAEILLEANFPTNFTFLKDDVVKEHKSNKPSKKDDIKTVEIERPLQNGTNKTITVVHDQTQLLSAIAVKTPKVKVLQVCDNNKENRNLAVTHKALENGNDFVRAYKENDRCSVADDKAYYSKTNDDAATITILKRNGNHDMSLNIMNLGFPETHNVKIEKISSRRLS